jgi:hypothetical protein
MKVFKYISDISDANDSGLVEGDLALSEESDDNEANGSERKRLRGPDEHDD